jgi:hypothetical protein
MQAPYLSRPRRAVAVAQLERLADGTQDLMMGKPIPDEALELLQKQLRDFIAGGKVARPVSSVSDESAALPRANSRNS